MLYRFWVRNAGNTAHRLYALHSRTYIKQSTGESVTAPPILSNPLNLKGSDMKLNSKQVSSCPAGTLMTGLNYLKGKEDPLALPDEEYPSWLWTCLENSRTKGGNATATAEIGDEYCKYPLQLL